MTKTIRRDFLKSSAIIGSALHTGIINPSLIYADSNAKMSIARFGSPSEEAEAIQEEAKALTKKSIELLGGMSRFISKGDNVWIKPNIAWDRKPEQAANTNPTVITTLIELCFEAGASNVYVSDNTCNPARMTFARSGIQKAAQDAGAECRFLDDRKFKKMNVNGKILKDWEVYTDIYEADKFINVPICKHHGLSKVSLSMKNLMGAIGGARDRLHQNIDQSLPDLQSFFKPDLIVLDAIRILKDHGPIGGNLSDVGRKDLVVAGVDPVAIDAFGAELLGNKPEDIGHIAEAAKRELGIIDYKSINPVEATV